MEIETSFEVFVCDICEKTFTTKYWKNAHIQSVHWKKKFNCDDCGKSFSSRAFLKKHHKSAHQNIKIDCEHCDKNFGNSNVIVIFVRDDFFESFMPQFEHLKHSVSK